MKLHRSSLLILPLLVLLCLAVSARADTISIGTAAAFAVLGEAGVTNTGPSVITGNVAGSTGTPSVTGFPPGIVNAPGAIVPLGAPASVFFDATTAFNAAAGAASNFNLSGQNLGGLTLIPGVYTFTSTAQLTGLLTLDGSGSNNAQWIFQIGSGLTTASASSVQVINAGAPGAFSGGITWEVGSAATLGTTTSFLGTIISNAGDTLATGATIGCGRVVSLGASVTLDTNLINTPASCQVNAGTGGTGGTGGTISGPPPPPISTPEPGTFALLSSGLLGMVFLTFRKSRVSSLRAC